MLPTALDELIPSFEYTLREMPLDGPGTEEQLRGDLRVRETVARESGNLLLLRCELVARLSAALSGRLTRGDQLAARPLGEPHHSHGGEHLMSRTKLLARVFPTPLAPQHSP
jgi:hypothetical protein